MINKLKEKSIQKEYNKLIVKKDSSHQINKVVKVAILLDNESLENVMIANLISRLPLKKENIDVLIYKEVIKKEEESLSYFSGKDFGFNGGLKSDILKNFVKNEYDLLINYVKTSNLFVNMVTLLSKSAIKSGFAGFDDRLYDLIISDKELNEAVLNQELKKYLTILNKI